MPDVALVLLIALVTLGAGFMAGAFIGERATHTLELMPPPDPPPTRAAPGAHVHTWRHRSSEDVAGDHVEVFRCLDCAAVERRIVEAGGARQ